MENSEDPSIVRIRYEATIVFFVWLVACVYTVGYCAVFGYSPESGSSLSFGVPSWVFWGIFLPWTISTVVSAYVAMVVLRDDDLGGEALEEVEEPWMAGHKQESVVEKHDRGAAT